MEIRAKIFFRLFGLAIIIGNILELIEIYYVKQRYELEDWIFLCLLPIGIFAFVFIGQTLTYQFTHKGASVYWKIGIGRFKLWEQTNYHLKWHEVVRVYSVFPVWLPFHMIGVSGIQNGMQGRNFFIGTVTTKKKEALLYVADHVSPRAIDEEVKRLVKRYRAKARKKEKTSTPAN